MARINIEDDFWVDITAVTRRLKGDESRAVGDAVRLFRVAQNRFKQGRIVSEDDWRIGEFTDALIDIFVKKVEGGYELMGAKKHFGWLQERVEAGRKGGLARGKATEDSDEIKIDANNQVNAAIKRGDLIRPEYCDQCGNGGMIDGHHEDYSKPLEVEWLCRLCHASRHTSKINTLRKATVSNRLQATASPSYSSSPSTGKTRINTTGQAGGGGTDFQSVEELVSAISKDKFDSWAVKYPQEKFLSDQIKYCFAYYTTQGADTPRALIGWERAISAWLDKNWNQLQNREALQGLLSNLGKKIEVPKQQRSN